MILIGHAGHPEVEGTQGRIPGGVHLVSSPADVETIEVRDPDKIAYVTQTTPSVDDTRDIIEALRRRFPMITGPDVNDICYATQNRQQAVRELTSRVDLLLVVGARNSSNSSRLREIGAEYGIPSYLIDDARSLDPRGWRAVRTVGVTAAPRRRRNSQDLIDWLGDFGEVEVEELAGVEEHMQFKLPRVLAAQSPARSKKRGIKVVSVPAIQQLRVGAYILRMKLQRVEKYLLVLMLEPLFRCTLPAPVAARSTTRIRSSTSDSASTIAWRRSTNAVPGDLGPGRRAAAPQGNRQDRRRHRCPQEVRLPVHQRAAAGEEAAPVQAQPVSHLLGAPGRPRRAPR